MALIPCGFDEVDADMPIDVAKWYAVTTNARCEKRAALSIMDALKPVDRWRDLAVYLPVETYWTRHARKRDIATKALLPRYIFVCIREQHMHLVRASDGVVDFVRAGGFPRPVTVGRLFDLRDREEAGEFNYTKADDFGGEYQPEQPVEVKLGKFTGWPGRVVRMTSVQKVRVVLSMFGKEHEKELDVTELRAA